MKDIIFTLEINSEWVSDIYYPVPAVKEIPDWYKSKNATDYTDGNRRRYSQTIKHCMPVFDAMTGGYFIKTFTDLTIRKDNNGEYEYFWAFDVGDSTITKHPAFQIENYKGTNNAQYIPKLRNPWGVKTPQGYSCLFIPPMHQPPIGIKILEGIVDTDKYVQPVQFSFTVDKDFEGDVPAGTVIAQVIPFKREEFKMQIGDDKIRKEMQKNHVLNQVNWFGSYKKFFRSKKSYL